jgi:FkbH-like protein
MYSLLDKINLQSVLFSSKISRLELQKFPQKKTEGMSFSMQVHRNQSFELVASVLQAFLSYSDLEVTITYSSYDNSLNFENVIDANIHLIWLDYSQYHNQLFNVEWLEWLYKRIEHLRHLTQHPILINDWFFPTLIDNQLFRNNLEKITQQFVDVYICSQESIFNELGNQFFDLRMAKIAATPISDAASLHNARLFGLKWLPALLKPRLKAIVVDLDNTLYGGVLGEDGVSGVVLNNDYIALQNRLLALKKEGVFLAVCSRNEFADAEEMFKQRVDFPLKMTDFSVMEICWEKKSLGIEKIANFLRIGIDSILFIDDNYGELVEVIGEFPQINCVLARSPTETELALEYFPNLWNWKKDETGELRIRDLEAVHDRQRLMKKSQNISEYMESLQIRAQFFYKPSDQRFRLHELSIKTNQFNTGFLRLSEQQIEFYISSTRHHVVSFRLQDKLSDSGIIGAIFGYVQNDILVIQEICISCRVLGRGLENFIITEPIIYLIAKTSVSQVKFCFTGMERNAPAKAWLSGFAQQPITDCATESITVMVECSTILSKREKLPISVEWKTNDRTAN